MRLFSHQVSAAIVNGGGIRESVEPGDITLADVMQIQPFGNTMDVVTLSGATLRGVFEHSVSQIADRAGRFLQVSGEKRRTRIQVCIVNIIQCYIIGINKPS